MRKVERVITVALLLFLMWSFLVLMAKAGEPQSAWLVCDFLGLDYCRR